MRYPGAHGAPRLCTAGALHVLGLRSTSRSTVLPWVLPLTAFLSPDSTLFPAHLLHSRGFVTAILKQLASNVCVNFGQLFKCPGTPDLNPSFSTATQHVSTGSATPGSEPSPPQCDVFLRPLTELVTHFEDHGFLRANRAGRDRLRIIRTTR